jgi:hypothetical protein
MRTITKTALLALATVGLAAGCQQGGSTRATTTVVADTTVTVTEPAVEGTSVLSKGTRSMNRTEPTTKCGYRVVDGEYSCGDQAVKRVVVHVFELTLQDDDGNKTVVAVPQAVYESTNVGDPYSA